jgi:hypothetical protein
MNVPAFAGHFVFSGRASLFVPDDKSLTHSTIFGHSKAAQ